MELFNQVNLGFPQIGNKDIVTNGVVISDDGSIILLPCIDVDTRCDLFKITITKRRNIPFILNTKNEHKLHIYYVFDNSNHVYHNFVCKFIGSYLSYEELPERCTISIAPGIKGELQKKDTIEINKNNFRKAVNISYKRCFILSKRRPDLIKVEPRNISNVLNCDFVFWYNKNKLGINHFLFNKIPFYDINESDKFICNIDDINIEKVVYCRNISEQTKRFYIDSISRFRVPKELVEYIKNDKTDENRYGFTFYESTEVDMVGKAIDYF